MSSLEYLYQLQDKIRLLTQRVAEIENFLESCGNEDHSEEHSEDMEEVKASEKEKPRTKLKASRQGEGSSTH